MELRAREFPALANMGVAEGSRATVMLTLLNDVGVPAVPVTYDAELRRIGAERGSGVHQWRGAIAGRWYVPSPGQEDYFDVDRQRTVSRRSIEHLAGVDAEL